MAELFLIPVLSYGKLRMTECAGVVHPSFAGSMASICYQFFALCRRPVFPVEIPRRFSSSSLPPSFPAGRCTAISLLVSYLTRLRGLS